MQFADAPQYLAADNVLSVSGYAVRGLVLLDWTLPYSGFMDLVISVATLLPDGSDGSSIVLLNNLGNASTAMFNDTPVLLREYHDVVNRFETYDKTMDGTIDLFVFAESSINVIENHYRYHSLAVPFSEQFLSYSTVCWVSDQLADFAVGFVHKDEVKMIHRR